MTTTTTFRGWKADALYLTDNGACYCGDHLGATAMASGRDLSGQKVHRLTDADKQEVARQGFTFSCESCGRK